MRIIKLISKAYSFLLNEFPGEFINLPEDSKELNSYIYDKEISNDNYYIIDVSPDLNNPLNYNGVNIALHIYFRHLQEEKLKFLVHLIGFDKKESFFYDCIYSLFLK